MSLALFFSALFLLITALDGNAMLTTANNRLIMPNRVLLDERMKDETVASRDPSTPAHENQRDGVDWRKMGCVTKVKNQGNCIGGGWAYAAADSIASIHCIKTDKLVELSAQQLIDCTVNYGNHGCKGRYVDLAYNYIIDNRGIEKQQQYKDTRKTGHECRSNLLDNEVRIKTYIRVRGGEDALLKAVSQNPVAVTVDASHDSFKKYTKGIYEEPNCSKKELNHAMLVVGYGSKGKGKDYWIVKNSNGTGWGMSGYMLMPRNKHNYCGIASNASYPILEEEKV